MWDVLAGPYLAAAGLLVVAGAPKVVDPMNLVRAIRVAGLPAGRPVVRVGALAEVVVGLWALIAPGRYAASLVAAAYLAFTVFVVRVLRRGGVVGSCGCFGKADTPATRMHAVLTGAAALVAAAVAVDPPASAWSGTGATTWTTVALAALVGFLAWQVMAVLPTLKPAAVRSTGRS
jgi:hypothetical protein